MKYLYSIIVILLLSSFLPAQQASDYFPDQTGFTWIYKVTPLDSANNPIISQTLFRIDSFTTNIEYEDSLANEVISKEGTAQLINLLPFTDSSYYYFNGPYGNEYVNVGRLELFLTALDSIVADSNFSFVKIFRSFENWYSTFRFDSNINQKYTLLSADTTVVINGADIPLRFEYNAVRLDDENLDTDIGSFLCKKFIRERGISFLIIPPPPLPPIPIPIAFFNDSIWVAENNWIVQSILPSTAIDLSLITGDTLTIPGISAIITDKITGIKNQIDVPKKFSLSQNFPNPFNPETNIQFVVAHTGPVKLKIFDILGCEIAVLVDEELSSGNYNIRFKAEGLPSGIYIYTLETGKFSLSRKMILLK